MSGKKIKLKQDSNGEWKVRVKGSGGGDIDDTPVDPANEPDVNKLTLQVTVYEENPHWVQVGTKWYLIP